MPKFDAVTREDVIRALAEYDQLGADAFLERYGFGRAREYVLWHDGRSYDSKAILGVAHLHATGSVAARTEFSGGKAGAAKVLRDLGFEVTSPDELAVDGAPATGSWRSSAEVGSDAARAAWAVAARDVLMDAARRYQAVITYKELAVQVQHRTGIRTSQLLQHWIGDVLTRVAGDCRARGEPNLSALCVNAQGSVGNGYAAVVLARTGIEPADLDDHAARDRLDCYRYFDAAGLPADGGAPSLTPQIAAGRSRARKAAREARPVLTCPTCHMALPATGICDDCR